MKWRDFRELPPVERRRWQGKSGKLRRAYKKWLCEAKKEARFAHYFNRPPGGLLSVVVPVLHVFQTAEAPEEFRAFLDLFLPNPEREGWRISAPQILLTTIKTDPHLMLGFWNQNREYIPGLLAALADDSYTDVLEEILSTENFSGLTVDEVVALCKKRGYTTNNDCVRQRIRDWEKA